MVAIEPTVNATEEGEQEQQGTSSITEGLPDKGDKSKGVPAHASTVGNPELPGSAPVDDSKQPVDLNPGLPPPPLKLSTENHEKAPQSCYSKAQVRPLLLDVAAEYQPFYFIILDEKEDGTAT